MADYLILSCEHGGNRIPKRYQSLFGTPEYQAMLETHRGYDAGALSMARQLAASFSAPLIFSRTSRLLVDLNRSVGHPRLHSTATRSLSADARRQLIDRHYRPYRAQVENLVAERISAGERIIHVSSHSFTPELDGIARQADVGLLYDPERPGEVAFCRRWQEALNILGAGLRIRRNYPYAGRNDGLTTALRRRYEPAAYIGVELEINQKYPMTGGDCWKRLRELVVESLRAALNAPVDRLPSRPSRSA